MAAANALRRRINAGDTVLIATGAGVAPKLPQGETDGPVGAAVLAGALARGLGARVVLVTEHAHLEPVAAAVRLMNAKLRHDTRAEEVVRPIEVATFPLGLAAGRVRAAEVLEQHRPQAAIFVERDGPNVEGYFHGVRGDCREPDAVGHVYLLARMAAEAGALTIGIGDGGNEVGFGSVRSAISAILPHGGRCQRGCVSGVVTVESTDYTVSASVSNWGAFAVVAALAVLLADESLLHTPAIEHELIAATVAAGARDGATSAQGLVVDGIDYIGHLAFVELLRTVAGISIKSLAARCSDTSMPFVEV